MTRLTVIEVPGTSKLIAQQSSTENWGLGPLLDEDLFNWQPCPYQQSLMPLSQSVANGMAAVEAILAANAGPWAIFGVSQGALISSNIYDEVRSGSLTARHDTLLGGFMFGNPRREEGHTFPGCPDPGGHGIDLHHLLSGSETLWWEFAHPLDGIAIQMDDAVGDLNAYAIDFISDAYTGCGSLFQLLFNQEFNPTNVILAVLTWYYTLLAGGHSYPNSWAPIPGDSRGCYTIVVDRLTEIQGSL